MSFCRFPLSFLLSLMYFFSIFYSLGPLPINFYSFCLSKIVFNLASYWNYSFIGWQFFILFLVSTCLVICDSKLCSLNNTFYDVKFCFVLMRIFLLLFYYSNQLTCRNPNTEFLFPMGWSCCFLYIDFVCFVLRVYTYLTLIF